MSAKEKAPRSDDEEAKIRSRVRDFIDGQMVTIVMTCFTLWALFGDDIRLYATDKPADMYFFVSFNVMLVFFVVEIFLTSVVVDDYKYSFFFWLDVIAAVSLIPDIPYIIDGLVIVFGSIPANANADFSPNSNGPAAVIASRVLKSFRLIRLVRIVKLYKYFTKSSTEEEEQRLREAQKQAQNVRQAAMNKEMDPTLLGKRLSDLTTKRVIIGVLLMIIILPILQVMPSDNTMYYGLQQIFWMGRSSCLSVDEIACSDSQRNWITEAGWYDLIYRYSKSSELEEGSSDRMPLLWLKVPNYLENGEITEIEYVPDVSLNMTLDYLWEQDDDCAGVIVPDECHLRHSEMTLAVYSPEVCVDEDYEGCDKLRTFARFNSRTSSREDALINIFTTIFIGIILAVASIMFTIDTQKIVIGPITKMVLIIKSLADDPLKKPETKVDDKELQDETELKIEAQTVLLEETIKRISVMLQFSFGEDGAQILSKNMSGEGELNLMRPGTRLDVIAGVFSMNNFSEITEALQDEATLYFNKVASIIHGCCVEWNGLPCKNEAGTVLILWRLPEVTDRDRDDDDLSNPVMKRTDISNRSLVAAIKVIAELRRSVDIQAYKTHPKILSRFGSSFSPSLTISLHNGMALEGVIGSEYKIDPIYLSPQIELAYHMIEISEVYDTSIIMTEDFYGYLSVKAKSCCRRVDTIVTKFPREPFGIYCYDLTNDEPSYVPEEHKMGQLIKLQELDSVNVESFQHKGVDYMFTLDSDIVVLQRQLHQISFFEDFRSAYAAYMSGEWTEAITLLEEGLKRRSEDGPSLSLLRYMQSTAGKPPEDWPRYRDPLA
mmetsp:Transcript_18182/g.32588  ORF Transcript_18182/g.32588 Transcript_18182/m.32588 type:complete len:831 (-) Transcript_18182:1201-3693(-)